MKTPTKHLIALMLMIIGISANAQDAVIEECASGILHEQLLESDPHYARGIWNLERKISHSHEALAERDDEIFTIPVVVHIVHEGEPVGQGSNISDEQIFSAITALNEDFRKEPGSNGDGAGVDAGIEFCLAARDPEGNSTNGIVRVDGSVVPDYAEMGISSVNGTGASEAAVKALSTWPGSDYLNIWIVNEIEDNDAGNGIQGYAYFPTVSPLDGIVLLHNVFGTVGNLKPSANLNRTASHEVGHYLALYHTFHNTNSCTELNCETGGDRVCDTPPTTLNTSCSSPACSGTQQVENYMDYTSETCRNMFSQGQSDRMRATLLDERNGLLQSLGCTPVTNADAGVTDISNPIGSLCSAQITPEIAVTNFGSNTLTSIEIEYGSQGSAAHSFTWTGSLTSGLSTSIELPAYTSGGGTQVFYASVTGVNGGNDEYSGNDQMTSNFQIGSGAGVSIVFTVDYFGSETTWELLDENNALMAAGGPYIDNNQGTQFIENVCLSEGCYSLHVYDEYGDGMGFTSGNFEVFDNQGNSLGGDSGNFGDESIVDFCAVVDEIEGDPPVANFSVNAQEICVNESVDFTNLSTGEGNTYNWTFTGATSSGSGQASPQNIVYDEAGTFNVTLNASNAFGSDIHTLSITVHPAPALSMSSSNVTCNGAGNGSASVLASGNGPFDYAWTGGGNGTSIGNLSPGSYSVTVTDVNDCVATSSVSITQASALNIALNPNDPTCAGEANGSITAQVTGGNGGNSYSWNSGEQTANISGIGAGTYTLTVNDSQGCQQSATTVLSAPVAIQTNLQAFDISCGQGSGSATVNPSGGNGSFNVSWSNGANGNNSGNLSAGSYSVTVNDGNNCTVTEDFEIVSGTALSVQIDATSPSCNGEANGSATAIPGGGTAPFSYEWNTGAETAEISGLSAGSYSVIVSDSNGCSGEAIVSIVAPDAIQVSVSVVNAESCATNDGSVVAEVNGGNGPYTYNWFGEADTAVLEDLSSGTYAVTITDSNGCEASASVFLPYDCDQGIEGPSLIQADCGSTGRFIDDEISCEIVEGAEMYLWRFENSAAGILTEEYTLGGNNTFQLSNIEGLVYGITLDVQVKALVGGEWSAFGAMCTVAMHSDIPVTQLTKQSCGVLNADDGVLLSCNSVAGADVYLWSFSNGEENITLESFIPQLNVFLNDGFTVGEVYEVTVSTVIGEQESEVGLTCEFAFDESLVVIDNPEQPSSLVIYPNPGNGSNLFFEIYNLSDEDDVIEFELYDTNGKLIEKFTLYYPGRSSFTTEHQFNSKLSAGMYFIQYAFADEVKKDKLIVR